MEGGEKSGGSSIATRLISSSNRSATDRKRKYTSQKPKQPAKKATRVVSEAPTLIQLLISLVSQDDHDDFNFMLEMYGDLLKQIVDTINSDDQVRGKICCKIQDEFLNFTKNLDREPEKALYYLRAYPIFLDWLSETRPLTDISRKALDQMLQLLRISVIQKAKALNHRPWRIPPVYDSPEQLARKLRPYAHFLKWLQEEETYGPNDIRPYNPKINCVRSMPMFLTDDNVMRPPQRKIDSVHSIVRMLRGYYKKIEGDTSRDSEDDSENEDEPAPDPPIRLSKGDRMLVERFRREDHSVAVKVLDEYHKYLDQLDESEGFDFDTYPGSFGHVTPVCPVGIYKSVRDEIDYKKLPELVIHERAKGKIKFKEVVRVNVRRLFRTCYYYLTFLGFYGESLHRIRALVISTLNHDNREEYEVRRFEALELPGDKRVTRASAKLTAQSLESMLEVDKPKAGRVARRSSKFIAQVSESMVTKERVSYDPDDKSCENHWEEMSRYWSYIDMPDDELLKKFRKVDKSTAKPLIKELRQYFEQVSNSEGFNIGQYPGFFSGVTSIKPYKWALWCKGSIPFKKLANLAIQSYNDDNGSQFAFESMIEVNVSEAMHYHCYITFRASTSDGIIETFQALVLVNMSLIENYSLQFCRIAEKTKNHE